MKINFILVEPKVPENIGASARAIKTMGFSNLLLVNPVNWLEGKALWVAHGSSDILEKAGIFSSLSDALSGSDFVIGTSAKQRTVRQDYVPISELRDLIMNKVNSLKSVSVVFGREESGLTNDEMKLCDIISSIPMYSPYPSLNLSQAVMLFAYELSALNTMKYSSPDQITIGSVRNLKQKIVKILSEVGVSEDDNIYGRILERVSFIKDEDINLFHSIAGLIIRQLAETKMDSSQIQNNDNGF